MYVGGSLRIYGGEVRWSYKAIQKYSQTFLSEPVVQFLAHLKVCGRVPCLGQGCQGNDVTSTQRFLPHSLLCNGSATFHMVGFQIGETVDQTHSQSQETSRASKE